MVARPTMVRAATAQYDIIFIWCDHAAGVAFTPQNDAPSLKVGKAIKCLSPRQGLCLWIHKLRCCQTFHWTINNGGINMMICMDGIRTAIFCVCLHNQVMHIILLTTFTKQKDMEQKVAPIPSARSLRYLSKLNWLKRTPRQSDWVWGDQISSCLPSLSL